MRQVRQVQQVFFSLLRSALGTASGTAGDLALGTASGTALGTAGGVLEDALRSFTPWQWGRLCELAVQQNVGAIVYQELRRLGAALPEPIEQQWSTFAEYAQGKFDAQLMALTHLAQVLLDEGIKVMVLKGLSLALLYPEPQLRECSDVDIFCFGQYERVNELLLRKGLIAGIDEENDKHCAFTFDGISVENHRYFSEYVNEANVLIGNEILRMSEEPALSDPRIEGIFFPSPGMGAHFLMMHTLSHLAWSGITIRHLIDCGLYFRKYCSESQQVSCRQTEIENQQVINCNHTIDRGKTIAVWEKAGIAGAAMDICRLCEETLGLPTGMIPSGWDQNFSDTTFIINSLLHPLKTSSQTRNPLCKLIRKVRWYRYRSVIHPIVYGVKFPDSFWKSFSFLRSGGE